MRAASLRTRILLSALFVLLGSIGIQLSAAIASTLFERLGTMGVSGLRMAIAAVVLLLIARPSLRGRSRQAWLGIVLFGVAMAAMNALFYNAVERLPLGIAVTFEFLGPLAVAAVAARKKIELLLPILTLIGVGLVGNPSGNIDPIGVLFALGAAAAFGGYTVFAGKVSGDTGGIDGLALSVVVAALVLAPFSVEALPRVDGPDWGVLALSGLLGVALTFTLDFLAVKYTSPRIAGTLFAIDPVMGSIVGALALGQSLSGGVIAGMLLVVLSGATLIWLAGRTRGPALGTPSRPETGSIPIPRDGSRL